MMLAIIGVTVLVLLLIGFIVRQRQEINQLKDTIVDLESDITRLWVQLEEEEPCVNTDFSTTCEVDPH